MKNAINYYYNLISDDIHQAGTTYYFNHKQYRYYLILYEDDPKYLNDIYNIHQNILKQGLYVHQIIINKEGQIITLINDHPYILIKTRYYRDKIDYNKIISFFNLKIFENNKYLLGKTNWLDLWASKNDNLEYQMSQVGQKYPKLRNSFSYYIGLGETGIQLINNVNNNKISKVIAHKRINYTDTLFDLYNPLNFVIDSRIRDITEYFKSCFFQRQDITDELNQFFRNNTLTEEEHVLFLARMLYPTYYFDVFEDIISGKRKECEIKKIIDLADNYERLLRKIYVFLKTKKGIMPIEWLDN